MLTCLPVIFQIPGRRLFSIKSSRRREQREVAEAREELQDRYGTLPKAAEFAAGSFAALTGSRAQIITITEERGEIMLRLRRRHL